MLPQNSAEIFARMPEADRNAVVQRLVKIERALKRRGKIASWFLWILDEPRVQQKLKEICNG